MRDTYAAERVELRSLITDSEYAAARATTVNAHYTDPAYVSAMWKALQGLGFDGGRVLEPGCGAGTFIGMAPGSAQMTGVELDPVTARIAGALYPQAAVRAESFAESRYSSGFFDAAIVNVPFADVKLHDRKHNAGGHAIHNHFIIKSLILTRPGGMVAVLSSSFTLDGSNPAARREMYSLGDLVGAVRLPTGAHRRAAGTEVVTDLLILRRREAGAKPGSDAWVTTQPRQIDGNTIRLNGYFVDHPQAILGDLSVGHGMYGEATVRVTADLSQTAGQLDAALSEIVSQAQVSGEVFTERSTVAQSVEQAAYVPSADHWQGHIAALDDGTFTRLTATSFEALPVPATQAAELRSLLTLRDLGREVLTYEAANMEDTPALDELRSRLAQRYHSYVDTYGPINRFKTLTSNRVDPETGEPTITRRSPPVMSILRKDPFGPFVSALEEFDEVTQIAKLASLLVERVITPRAPIMGADNPEDALAVSMDSSGFVDLAQIAGLLGVSADEAREQLGTLVYDDPETAELVPAAEYLSGNVRVKLDQARDAMASQPQFIVNVSALEAVQPVDLGADEIAPRIGAVWISAEYHQQFLRELLNDPYARIEHPGGTIWEVKSMATTVAATSEWGTERRPTAKIMQALLEQKPIQVHDEDDEGRRILNTTETEAAREKADLIQERFNDWVWEDPERADALITGYNRRFNSLVLRDYSAETSNRSLPGMAKSFTPRPHQVAAVARMVSEPAVGLFHQVGAGKTAEMVMGAMELRRLGMARKPVCVVPNHMLEQFSREWLQLYPQARILAAWADDLAGDKRREFVARTATNDWDAVIMTRSAFQRIQVSWATKTEYMESELEQMRSILARAQSTDNSRDCPEFG